TRIPVYVSHFPAGTSSMNILHWVQLVKAGIAVRFNYGEEMNIATYGQKTPPTYDFRNISNVPIYVFAGGNDWIADEEDLENYLLPQIRSQVQLDKRLPEYNHFDFIWGLRAAADVYKPITDLIQENFQRQGV
ncbi:Ab-hydrolase associated lipase region, partial [Trichostrongylus colubriformis]